MTKLSDTQRVILSRAAQHEALLAEPPAKLPAAARQSVLRSLIAKGLLEEVPASREVIALSWRQDQDCAWIALRITIAGLAAIGLEPEGATAGETGRTGQPEDDLPRDKRPGADPRLVIGDLADARDDEPTAPESAASPAGAQGDSLAAFPCAPPLMTGGEASQAPQRPSLSPHGAVRRESALRSAAAGLLAAWEAPDRGGLDDAIAASHEALAAKARAPHSPTALRQPRTGTKQGTVLALLRRDEGTSIAKITETTGWQPHTVRGFLAGLKRRGINVDVLERVRQVGPNRQGAKGSYSIYRIAPADGAGEAG